MDPFDLKQWDEFLTLAKTSSLDSAIIDQIAIDSRRIDSQNSLFVALKGRFHDGHEFVREAAHVGAKFALVDSNYHCSDLPDTLTLIKVQDPLRAFQQIVKAYRKTLKAKIIAITGSYGKTMLKDLLETLISAKHRVASSPESFNSQIGVPLSLLTIKREHEIALIEAAISKKGEMNYLIQMIQPDATILSHIGKKHIPTLGSLGVLAGECAKMLTATTPKGWVLIPQSPLISSYLSEIKASTYFWNTPQTLLPFAFPLTEEKSHTVPFRITFPNDPSFDGTMTMGYSYFLNLINMATQSAWLMGIDAETIIKTISNYSPESMRTEIWKTSVGTTFINDPYSSDPQSVDQALRYFELAEPSQHKTFIFGGIRSQSQHLLREYSRIGQAIERCRIDTLILHGDCPFDNLKEQISSKTKIVYMPHFDAVVKELKPILKWDDFILIKGRKKHSIDALSKAFQDSIYTNQCLINLESIRSNLETIQKTFSHSPKIMVMVKALAYGTDATLIAKFLNNCGIDTLGVSYVDEGVSLRASGVRGTIFVLNAAKHELIKVVKWDLEVGVSEKEMIAALNSEGARQDKIVKVHLHVDTGMGRFGCRPEEALELAKLIYCSSYLHLEGMMTHFACAEDPSADAFTYNQIKQFDASLDCVRREGIQIPWVHAANSSAALRFSLPGYNMIRIGVGVYGLYASDEVQKQLDLKNALSLTSRIVGINVLKEGETVGYGAKFRATRMGQKIAILPIGYFDGLHLNYSGKGHVLIRGQKAPMVGRICMDFMMVDITDIANASMGDTALIFGEDEHGNYISPELLARQGGSIIHELITCLGPRIQRVFVD